MVPVYISADTLIQLAGLKIGISSPFPFSLSFPFSLLPSLSPMSQYMNGGTLEQLLSSPEPLSWPVRLHLALDIAQGLRYLHAKGVFHRDLTSKVGWPRWVER